MSHMSPSWSLSLDVLDPWGVMFVLTCVFLAHRKNRKKCFIVCSWIVENSDCR